MYSRGKPYIFHVITGVNGDTVDVIFGNLCEIVKVETEMKSSLDEMKVIVPSHALLPIGSIFNYFARVSISWLLAPCITWQCVLQLE